MVSAPAGESTQTLIEGVPVVLARSLDGQTLLAIAPQLGGAVMQLVLGGRQWLARNGYVPLTHRYTGKARPPNLPRPYAELGDIGLGDQCLFTVAPDVLSLPDGQSVPLLDHGLAWPLRPPEVTVVRRGEAVVTTWRANEAPLAFRFERESRVAAGGIVCRFRLLNEGAVPLPLFWSSHDSVELDRETRFQLPEGTEMVVFHARRVEFAAGVHRWPRFTLKDGRPVDLSHPAEARARIGRDFACKLFSREQVGPVGVKQGGRTLTLACDGTRVGLWINWGGDSPPGERYQIACPERCWGGATDRVSEAIHAGTTSWLESGGEHLWTLHYGLVPGG